MPSLGGRPITLLDLATHMSACRGCLANSNFEFADKIGRDLLNPERRP